MDLKSNNTLHRYSVHINLQRVQSLQQQYTLDRTKQQKLRYAPYTSMHLIMLITLAGTPSADMTNSNI
jgi:hypothetical protein